MFVFILCQIRVHSLGNHIFIKSNLTVILLIDIQVLHQAFMQEILKGSNITNMFYEQGKICVCPQLF